MRLGSEPATVRRMAVIEAARGRHSEKPGQAYELIERMYPAASKITSVCALA